MGDPKKVLLFCWNAANNAVAPLVDASRRLVVSADALPGSVEADIGTIKDDTALIKADVDLLTDSGAIPKQTVSVVVENGNSSAESDITVEGYINQILFNTPSIDGGGATAEIKILNENDKERYASGELAESSDHVINREMRLSGTTTISIETSISVGADKTFAIEIY